MSEIRGFDPSLVQRKHVFPKTLIYGNDIPGIQLRMDRFEEVLKQSGDEPAVYATASDALGYLLAGDMFSDSICIIVKDISDALKTSPESKKIFSALTNALSTYDDSSTIVFAAPMSKSTSALKDFIKRFEQLGGTVRSVIAPDSTTISQWIDEYAKSINTTITQDDKNKLISVSEGDIEIARNILSVVGLELSNLDENEIRQWMSKEAEFTGSDIRAALVNRDIKTLTMYKQSFGSGAAAYRTFLLKVRLNAFDLLIPAASDGKPEPLLSYKQNQYANANGKVAYFIARETNGRQDYARYARIYAELNKQISALASSGQARFEDLLIAIASD